MLPNQGTHLAGESHQNMVLPPLLVLAKGLRDPHGVVSHVAFGGEAFLFLRNGQNLNYPCGIQFGVECLGLLTYFSPNGQAFG